MLIRRIASFTVLGIAMTGCAASTEPDEPTPAAPSSPATQTQESLTSVTSVELLPDGTSRETTVLMTADEVREEIRMHQDFLAGKPMVRAARPAGPTGEGVGQTAQAIEQDTLCAGSSLWLYNASTTTCEMPSSPPNGARILCFKGTGTADLHAYGWFEYPCLPAGSPTCVPTLVKRTWDHQVTRYWPGIDAGMFWDATCTGWYCVAERFKASQACTVAGSIAKTANRVCLGTGC